MNAIFTVSADAAPEASAMQTAAPAQEKRNFSIDLSPMIFESILYLISQQLLKHRRITPSSFRFGVAIQCRMEA
jgi:hypothetical protein